MADIQQERRTTFEQDGDLLHRYVQHGSQAAFDEIVRRHLPFVYATCLREVHSPELAQDVTQVVFLILVQKAATLRNGTVLAAWLFQTARYAARNILRKERRRMRHELPLLSEMDIPDARYDALWTRSEPLLNTALAVLNAGEREAVLLRYVQERSLRETSAVLGLREDAARMRITRALEKMRRHLAKAGVTLSVATLAALLSESTGRTAPHLPTSFISLLEEGTRKPIALTTSRTTELSRGVQHTMKMMKWKIGTFATLGAVLLIGGVTIVKTGGNPLRGVNRLLAVRAAETKDGVVPTMLADLILPERGTYTFDVTDRDVRTPQQRAKDLKQMAHSYDDQAQQGRMTRQQADKAIQVMVDSLNREPTEKRSTVTLSARDGKLLLVSENVTPAEATLPSVYLYDGENSLTLTRRPELNQADVLPGMYLWKTWELLPLPGVGLDSVPLLKMPPGEAQKNWFAGNSGQVQTIQGRVPTLHLVNGALNTVTPLYHPGRLCVKQVEGKLQVVQAQAFQEGTHKVPQLESQWDFQNHHLLEGKWIASRIRHTIFGNDNHPTRVIEFQLQSTNRESAATHSFEIEPYLREGKTLFSYDSPEEQGATFVYDLSRSNWQQQVAEKRHSEGEDSH